MPLCSCYFMKLKAFFVTQNDTPIILKMSASTNRLSHIFTKRVPEGKWAHIDENNSKITLTLVHSGHTWKKEY